MRKKGIVISLLVAIALLASGCVIHNKTNGWIYEDTGKKPDGIIDRGYRLHEFVKPELDELNGAWIVHMNMDEKILDADGKILAINHENVQYVVTPPDQPDLELGLSAIGFKFGKKNLLWVAVATITSNGSGNPETILDMTGEQAHTLYDNIRDIIARGARYEDGTERWTDAEPQ